MQIRQTAINARSQKCDVIRITTYVTARLALLVVGATNHYKCNEERCIDTNTVILYQCNIHSHQMPPDTVDDISLIQFWSKPNQIDILTMKWNSCIDLGMNSLSHNSLLQGLRLLNRHMLQTTQLVINSLRELALPEYKCMNGKNVRIIIMRSMYRFDPMSESIWSQELCLPKCRCLWCIWIPPAVFACHRTHLPLASPPIHLQPLCHAYLSPLPPHMLLRRNHQFSL